MEVFTLQRLHNRAKKQNRRANKYRRKGLVILGHLTLRDLLIFFLEHDHCQLCGSVGPLSIDHVVPLSKGGSNSLSNLQALCCLCNSSKGSLVVDYRLEVAHGEY